MKKIMALSFVALLLLSLCSCGGKPEKTSDAMYQIGLNALSTADDYIAGTITGEEAKEQIEEFSSQADTQYTKSKSDYENDWPIMFEISMLSYKILDISRGTGSMSEVTEARDSLAKMLGK